MTESALIRRLRWRCHRRRSGLWFVSFPKSGRTWTRNVLEHYLSLVLGTPDFAYDRHAPWLRRGIWRQVPRMVFNHPHCRDVGAVAAQRFREGLAGKRVVLMVRDPRAVVYSYYFRLRDRFREPAVVGMPLSVFLRDEEFGMPAVVAFTNAWCSARRGLQETCLLRLEDIKADAPTELGRLVRFLGLPDDPALLRRACGAVVDRTTRGLEDPRVAFDESDMDYMDRAMAELDPQIGYDKVPNPFR